MTCQQESSDQNNEHDGPILVDPFQVRANFGQQLSNHSRKKIHNTLLKAIRGIVYGNVEFPEQESCTRLGCTSGRRDKALLSE
jgi:hypothetical protein